MLTFDDYITFWFEMLFVPVFTEQLTVPLDQYTAVPQP